MEVEDVIELGSSDEESDAHPRKKMKSVENAMVHIPRKLHGVTIKPVNKANATNTQKLFSGKNITVTKLSKPPLSAPVGPAGQMKTPIKSAHKTPKGVMKKKMPVKTNVFQNKVTTPMVINPLSQVKRNNSQTFVNCGVTKLQNPIPISNVPALKKLPPSVTIKKTTPVQSKRTIPTQIPITIINAAKVVPKRVNPIKRKTPVLQTVELDDEESSQSSKRPRWYVTPEDQTKADATTQESLNNKEPEKPAYIEITIEDSPIKPPKTKRTRELSIETVVTIEDSPNKDGTQNINQEDGSDEEANTSKKIPHSKKKLEYEHALEKIEETHTFEIEIEPVAISESITSTEKDSKIVTLIPSFVEVEESVVEIAENSQGDISVAVVEVEESVKEKAPSLNKTESDVQVEPAQLKEITEPSTSTNDNNETEFSSTYLSFIDLCLELENSDDMKKIVEKKIKTYYRQVPKEYTESEEFIDMVSSKVAAIKAAPEKMYLYIKDIVDELNLQRKLAKQMPVLLEKPKEPETFSLGKDGDYDPSKQRQIRKLEKTLKKLNRAIQKLEMQEVDFEDDEDSVYLLTEKYKEKMVRVHAKFCQLTNSKMPSEPRLVIEPRPGLAPGPAKRLEAWINRNNKLTFPDFHDVLRCVKEANEEDKLNWNDAFIMEEARDLFIRCGKKLQRRRQEKEWRIATSRVTLSEDPAEHSTELKKRLEDNRRLASNKENEVINLFSDRQNQLKLEAVDINDKEAEESPEESEEEENDESLSLESKQRRKERLKRLLHEQSKKNPTKKPQSTEIDTNEQEVSDITSASNDKFDNTDKLETFTDDNSIQSLSNDDSNEMGSDVDELHLLQKLHSDHERRNDTGPESSDSETPIAISDTLDSSSDESNIDIQEKPCDIISIENSSYSDESDSQQGSDKTNKEQSEMVENVVEESLIIECSPNTVAQDPIDDTVDNVKTTTSDIENNASELGKDSDECVFNDQIEDVQLTSITKNESVETTSPKECFAEKIETIPRADPPTTTNSVDILLSNHKENNKENEFLKKTEQVIPNKKDNLVPESKYEASGTDSIVQNDLVTQSTSNLSSDVNSNSKSQSNHPNDLEGHTIGNVDLSTLASKSVSFDSNDILAASASSTLENTNCQKTSIEGEKDIIEPKESISEVLEECRSGDVGFEAEMGSEILISNVVSIRKPDLTNGTLKENLNPNQDLEGEATMESDIPIISNGNSNDEIVSKNDVTELDIQDSAVVIEQPTSDQVVDSVEKKSELEASQS